MLCGWACSIFLSLLFLAFIFSLHINLTLVASDDLKLVHVSYLRMSNQIMIPSRKVLSGPRQPWAMKNYGFNSSFLKLFSDFISKLYRTLCLVTNDFMDCRKDMINESICVMKKVPSAYFTWLKIKKFPHYFFIIYMPATISCSFP